MKIKNDEKEEWKIKRGTVAPFPPFTPPPTPAVHPGAVPTHVLPCRAKEQPRRCQQPVPNNGGVNGRGGGRARGGKEAPAVQGWRGAGCRAESSESCPQDQDVPGLGWG